ncbi:MULTISPECIES: peptide deformylase [Brevibacillus]|jgi:peptide deformylase|uniref:Peptide deformylase n=1 Tax=Brevibacillus thermoruber TaxID=33942 RepID=A0A9X3Z2E8_9BACL|nr:MULTISPECIES: peptide deformylase [Brevibacillus]MDA5107716.1 peptide deformylase [Brevibacillus thermoruber]TRY25586.1 peptide deformylase [Brevibacillus sp. LEMMJ03]UYZ15010.1 peptide deformylase [Brevibacillus sp. WF146]
MAIRTIVKHPDPILREKAAVVTKFNANLHKLLDDMAETMYDADGVGLAAPQVGVSKRVIVMDCGDGLIEVVNPEIIAFEGEQFDYPEGCLSIPGLRGDVRRHKWIKLRGQDRYGNVFEMEADDLLSRCAQHEIDHLNGVLFIDIADRVYPISKEEEGE